jgi:hypothetical protein
LFTHFCEHFLKILTSFVACVNPKVVELYRFYTPTIYGNIPMILSISEAIVYS